MPRKDGSISLGPAAGKNGWTPLRCAAKHGHVKVLVVLIKKEHKVHAAGNGSWTSLLFFCYLQACRDGKSGV